MYLRYERNASHRCLCSWTGDFSILLTLLRTRVAGWAAGQKMRG